MKTFMNRLTVLAAFALTIGATQIAQAAIPTKDVPVGISGVYIPGGFDSTADAYVVVNGLFPNGCYKWKGAQINHVDTYNHEIQPIASVSQGMCLMVIVPYTNEVRLGKLNSGQHSLKFLNGDGTYLERNLQVE